MGAHNPVAGADQGFRAPSWDQESVRDSVHEDSTSARIAAGQRPRPSFRHPQAGVDRSSRLVSHCRTATSQEPDPGWSEQAIPDVWHEARVQHQGFVPTPSGLLNKLIEASTNKGDLVVVELTRFG